MPFDSMTAARPYRSEFTASLALLVQSNPAPEVLRNVAEELRHRSMSKARKLLAEVEAMLAPVVADHQVPITPGEPIGKTEGCYPGWHQPIVLQCVHGEVVPEQREEVVEVVRVTAPEPATVEAPAPIAKPRAVKASKAPRPTREENQASRRAHFALLWRAMDSAEKECGRDAFGQTLWAGVPGAAHMVRVPPHLGWYITLEGRAQKEPRERVMPAPRFWPGGALPEGYEDLGPHAPSVVRQAQPGSKAWMRWVEVQARHMIKGENDTMAGRTYNAMHAKPKRQRAA